jgi:hypothetical protein
MHTAAPLCHYLLCGRHECRPRILAASHLDSGDKERVLGPQQGQRRQRQQHALLVHLARQRIARVQALQQSCRMAWISSTGVAFALESAGVHAECRRHLLLPTVTSTAADKFYVCLGSVAAATLARARAEATVAGVGMATTRLRILSPQLLRALLTRQ